MPKRRKAIIAGLVRSGAPVTGTEIYGTTAALADRPLSTPVAGRTAVTVTASSTATRATEPTGSTSTGELRSEIADMLKDHMGSIATIASK